jgi:peroxiredoxin
VLGASFDAVDKNRAFADKFSFPFKLLTFDKDADPFEANDPSDPGWPARISYLIGPDRRIVKAYATVVPAKHPAQVLADVAAL